MPELLGELMGKPAAESPGRPGFNSILREGSVRQLMERFVVPDTAAVGDVLVFGKLPAGAIPLTQSKIATDAMGAGVTMDIGFRHRSLSGAQATAASSALISGRSLATASSNLSAVASNVEDYGKSLAQLADLDEDFNEVVEMIGTITAGSSITGGNLAVHLLYVSI